MFWYILQLDIYIHIYNKGFPVNDRQGRTREREGWPKTGRPKR